MSLTLILNFEEQSLVRTDTGLIGEVAAGGAEIKTAPLEEPVLYRRGAPQGEPKQ